MQNLLDKKCVPCEGKMPPLTADQIEEYSSQALKWGVLENKKIRREFPFKNFKEAMAFVNKVADLAESEGHHPDIHLYDWSKVRIDISTHAVNGLSENDFILAVKIDKLYWASVNFGKKPNSK